MSRIEPEGAELFIQLVEAEEATIYEEIDKVRSDQGLEVQAQVKARTGVEETIKVAKAEDQMSIEAEVPKSPVHTSALNVQEVRGP